MAMTSSSSTTSPKGQAPNNANNGGQRNGPEAVPLSPTPFPRTNGTTTAATSKTTHAAGNGHGGGAGGRATPTSSHGASNTMAPAHEGKKPPKAPKPSEAPKTATSSAKAPFPTGGGNTTVPATPSPGRGNAGNANVGKQDGNGTALALVGAGSGGNSTKPAAATGSGKLVVRERKLLKLLGPRKKGENAKALRQRAESLGAPAVMVRGLYDHLGRLRAPGARTAGKAGKGGGHHHDALAHGR
jgi:hypothetical protein